MNNNYIKSFEKLLLSNLYIEWLSSFLDKHKDIDTLFFPHEHRLGEYDQIMIDYISLFYKVIYKYCLNSFEIDATPDECLIKYNNKYYNLYDNGECITATKEKFNSNSIVIDYEKLLSLYKPKEIANANKSKYKIKIRKK